MGRPKGNVEKSYVSIRMADELIDAISDVDTVDIDMKLEFVKDDDEWLVEDVEDILEETYSEFTMYSLVFALVNPYYESNYGFEGYSGNGDLDFFGMGYDGVYDVEDDCEIGYASSDSVWISVYLMYDMSEGDVDLSGYYSEVVKDGEVVINKKCRPLLLNDTVMQNLDDFLL